MPLLIVGLAILHFRASRRRAGLGLAASPGRRRRRPTCAGRSSRSPMVKPSLITWMMSPALVPGTGASNIAWCSLGSKRSPACGLILTILCRAKAFTRSRWVSSIPSIRPGRRAAHRVGDVAERPVEVVVHRQEVARQARGAIDLGVAAVALGALADVLHVGERAEQAVLEVGHLGAQRRGLVLARRLPAASSASSSASSSRVVQEDLLVLHEIVPVLVLRHLVHSPSTPGRGWTPAGRPAAPYSRRSARSGRS